ncbi:HK97-gp10 family putative phage morphogenesis protein [Rossellomorea vietnamensis]|uniref:HK97-gp10 family putative phage morphogenesis protein n=1 Tax=Rossellomorea vietnamensis TaxID=218284 RepID=UPI0005517941|nr:HK97-gp10 family putative phage morphogenesis protein [Rossellomorea vietnamensis]
MADYFFDIEGIDLMLDYMDRIDEEMERRIDQTLKKLAKKIIFDAKKLAPVDSGDLEAALIIDNVVTTLRQKYIDFGNSPEVDHYAVVQHEGFRKTSAGTVIYMSPREVTESKGPHKGFLPGKKFLENAIKINEELILRELAQALGF